jgi:predicted ABC-type ATPase
MSDQTPQLIVIAGPNAAGKSTLAPFLLRDALGLTEFVNADTLAAGLSAFRPERVAIDNSVETEPPMIAKGLGITSCEIHQTELWLRFCEAAERK